MNLVHRTYAFIAILFCLTIYPPKPGVAKNRAQVSKAPAIDSLQAVLKAQKINVCKSIKQIELQQEVIKIQNQVYEKTTK